MIISFEGLDGCGKSTQVAMTSEYLKMSGKKVTVLREPGGNPISEKIRDILLDRKNLSMSDSTELLLYAASRSQLVAEEIAGSVKKGYTVILDRFVDSTTAYQGYGRGLDLNIVKTLNYFVTSDGEYYPDITFLLDLDPETSLSRVLSRGEEINRMESSETEFFKRVRQGFLQISEQEPERVIRIDATGNENEIFTMITAKLKMRKLV